MTLTVSIVIIVVALLLVGFSNYKSRQPLEVGKIRWIPYQGLQFVGIIVIVAMLAHIVTLLTGKPLIGRFG